MRTIFTLFFIAFAFSFAAAQETFKLTNASKYFDVALTVDECESENCRGKASFAFYKKGAKVPFQTIKLDETYVQLGEGGKPLVNKTLLYDEQSAINIGDFNFDGMEDVAVCTGLNGSYSGPSYDVYLSSKTAGKFVYSQTFSELGTHLGMFTVDAKKKVLRTFDKSGCCWHITEEYAVRNNRPVKVFVEEEDATIPDETKVKITTKKLIKGKWQTTVSYVKRNG